MRNKIQNFMKGSMKKGGIETIVGVVLIVGILVALLLTVIIPMATKTGGLGDDTESEMDSLSASMSF